jgi:hypothetical protein
MRDVYFHNFEPDERRYHDRPGHPPNRRPPGPFCFREIDFDLEADSVAFNGLELLEGLLGDIDGALDASRRSISKTFARSKRGRWEEDVHRRSPPGQHTLIASHTVGIGDDVDVRSSRMCGA